LLALEMELLYKLKVQLMLSQRILKWSFNLTLKVKYGAFTWQKIIKLLLVVMTIELCFLTHKQSNT
jgi:hypothetical protein